MPEWTSQSVKKKKKKNTFKREKYRATEEGSLIQDRQTCSRCHVYSAGYQKSQIGYDDKIRVHVNEGMNVKSASPGG